MLAKCGSVSEGCFIVGSVLACCLVVGSTTVLWFNVGSEVGCSIIVRSELVCRLVVMLGQRNFTRKARKTSGVAGLAGEDVSTSRCWTARLALSGQGVLF